MFTLQSKAKAKGRYRKILLCKRTIQFWNQLPADVLGTLSCKPSNFRKRVMKVINKAKLGGWDNQKGSEVNCG
jgi:hypothetical protein